MRRRIRWAAAAAVLAAVPLVAQQVQAPVPEAEAHRATALPDRIIATWQGDPARTFSVTWRTDTSVARALGQIAPAEPGPAFAAKARSVQAHTTPLTTDLGSFHCHTVRFDGLEPETKYAYRVGDGANWSAWIHFRTASAQPKPFSFIYFGDAQNDIKSHWSRVIREAYSDMPRAAFIIHAGDLINNANRDAQWGEWHGAGAWVNAMVPSVPVPGNHEYELDSNDRRSLSRHWRPQFALPENGPPGLEETAYTLEYQGVRILCLNSNEKQAEQARWMEEVLRENRSRWTVATFHHPIFSTAKGRDNKELRQLWHPVFERWRVDLVLTGHDHSYGRSNMRTGLNVRNPASGTVYVVSVSGPKMYDLERQPWMARAAEDTQLYQLISVNGDRLRYEARTAVGEVYDAFELRKRRGLANELIDQTPRNVPERLRPPSHAHAP